RGAQGDRRPPGPARLPGDRRHVADRVDPGQARGGAREVRSPPRVGSGEPVIDLDRLAGWMDGEGLAKGEPIETNFIAGGSQNEIYEIRRGDVHGALRIPPTTAPESRDEGIL